MFKNDPKHNNIGSFEAPELKFEVTLKRRCELGRFKFANLVFDSRSLLNLNFYLRDVSSSVAKSSTDTNVAAE